jgi:hypothetical protein
MIKAPMTRIERAIAERELSRARRMLKDLVEIYDSGNWRHYFKKSSFAHEVRRARLAVDHWTDICNGRRHA